MRTYLSMGVSTLVAVMAAHRIHWETGCFAKRD
jgi:hypothetical protein